MASHPFRIVNVFTQGAAPLSGNALCVFEHGEGLSDQQMQALARQFNLSETTFLLPSARANARVRIFTPSYEMPFAGHPTLGSAYVCRALNLGGDEHVLEMNAGLVSVRARGSRWTLKALNATWRNLDVSIADLAAALGLDERDIGDKPLWVKAGKEQLIVPLTSADAVRRAQPVPSKLKAIRSDEGQSTAYVFCLSDATAKDSGEALARFFFPDGGAFLEDPATGSATANFGGWCLAMKRPLPVKVKISQGEQVRRPSWLFLDVTREREIFVGGDVVEIGRGTISLG